MLTETLANLSKGLEIVNSTIERQHSLLSTRIEALTTSSSGLDRPSRTSLRRREGQSPYKREGPVRRSKKKKLFSVSNAPSDQEISLSLVPRLRFESTWTNFLTPTTSRLQLKSNAGFSQISRRRLLANAAVKQPDSRLIFKTDPIVLGTPRQPSFLRKIISERKAFRTRHSTTSSKRFSLA